MKRVAVVSLVVLFAVAAASAITLSAVDGLTIVREGGSRALFVRMVVVLLVNGVTMAGVAAAAVAAMRRTERNVRSRLDGAGGVISWPAWLGGLGDALAQVVERMRKAESAVNGARRDLEVRLKVAETERERDRAVLDALSDAVIVTDAFDEVVFVNAGAARLFGIGPDEAVHKPISNLLKEPALCRGVTESRELGVGSGARVSEHSITVSDHTAQYDVSMECVADHQGGAAGVVIILHDLTREREVAQMKTDFVAKASHELRTPLSSIRAYIEMLVDGEASDEAARTDFYQIIHAETDRLGRLIDNMLNISKIEAGIVQIERADVDLAKIARRTIETLEPQAGEKKITLNSQLANVDLNVEGDEDMIYQVMLNLVSNAIKYTPESGRVTISADTDNLTRSVVVSVSDTGLGIPPDAIEKVFDKFYRVDNYKRVAKGTGLGLSLCKHIVETLHRGQIGLESQLGMGSRFWFTIPMKYIGTRSAA